MLYPKYQKFLTIKKSQDHLVIPDEWSDFARLVKIRSGGNVVPFIPYDYQIKLVELMLERSVIVCKSRQLGISETITNFLLWRACRNPGYLGLVFSKTQQDSSLLARRMRRMIESVGLKTTTENLSDIEIQNCGRILFRNSKPESGRGLESVVDIFYDEFAFIDGGKEIYDAVMPSQQMVGKKARTFIVSTPNGRMGHYWDMLSLGNQNKDVESICNEISKPESEPFQHWVDEGDWSKILIHWRSHPIYGSNPLFLEDIHNKQKLTWTTINQEYNLSFAETESNYFSVELVQNGARGMLEEPVSDGFYFMGIDAVGMGQDYGVCVVLRKVDNLFSLVQFHRKRGETNEYHIFKISELIKKYRPIKIGCETTGGYGEAWFQELSRIHFHLPIERISTTHDSKISMVSKTKIMLEMGRLIFPENNPLRNELLSFRYNKEGKLEAAVGKNDDMVMGTSFALKVAI